MIIKDIYKKVLKIKETIYVLHTIILSREVKVFVDHTANNDTLKMQKKYVEKCDK